jgi:hypothetical protein
MNKEDKAFPSLDLDKNYSQKKILSMAQSGLNTRDYIAIKAMQGMIANGAHDTNPYYTVANHAYAMADAMIEQSEEDVKE